MQGSPMSLTVEARRRPKFRSGLRVRVLEAPPGVRASSVTLSKNSVAMSLSASTSAAPGSYRVHAVARVYGRGSFYDVASGPIELKTAKRKTTVRMGAVRGELSVAEATTLKLPVEFGVLQPWVGNARVELRGLPKGVEVLTKHVSAKELAKVAGKMTVELRVAAKTRPGRFRNLLLRLRIPTATGTVVEDWRGGEVRIDPATKPDAVGGGR